MKLHFIRHGEAVTPKIEPFSAKRLAAIDDYSSGLYTGDLTKKGQAQAREVARHLENKNIQLLMTSPIPRALQTAEIVSEHLGLPLEVTEDLKEISVGYLDPMDHRFLRLQMETVLRGNDLYNRLTGKPLFLPVALYFVLLYLSRWLREKTRDGEPRHSVNNRIESVLEHVRTHPKLNSTRDNVALFTHGYLVYYLANHQISPKGMLLRLARMPYVKNGSLTTVERKKDNWVLKCYGKDVAITGSLGVAGG